MCRCEKPRWVLAGRPGITSPAMSKCEGCHDIYMGYPLGAEAECKRWQKFFAFLSRNGITNQGAQNQLWGRHGWDITRQVIKPEELPGLLPRFHREMAEIGMPCA